MYPTPQQIAAGVAAAKEMITDTEVNVPFFIKEFIAQKATDEAITNAVTRVVTAALNAPTTGA
jgi:hypothetical protein